MDPVITWIGIFLCLSQSAMLSGLNLACFSVSRLQLEIEASQNNQDAIKVLKLRRDSNFLLTTILWGNVGVNTLLALLAGSVLGGIAAFVFSTLVITILAEMIPQAYFSRNALRVASLLSPGVRFYQLVLYPVAKPTAKMLDLWLGPEGVHYLREGMLKQYFLRSMGIRGSEIGTFEGKGAINFLALDSRRVGDEGSILDPSSLVRLPVVNGGLDIPRHAGPDWSAFLEQVQASGRRWVVLTDTEENPQLVMNAHHFLRVSLSSPNAGINPRDYCVEPIITTNPQDTLESVLMEAKPGDGHTRVRRLILLWARERRIITHVDVLTRLFEGVFPPPGTAAAPPDADV